MFSGSLPGRSLGQLEEALLEAFVSREQFERLLLYELEIELDRIVGQSAGMEDVVFRVLARARRDGWLGELADAARRLRPHSALLQEWIEQHDHYRVGPATVPPGRGRNMSELIEHNLRFELTRAMLLLHEPGNPDVLDATDIDGLIGSRVRESQRRLVRRYLHELADAVLDFVEGEIKRVMVLNAPFYIETVDECTDIAATAIRNCLPHLTAEIAADPEALRELLAQHRPRHLPPPRKTQHFLSGPLLLGEIAAFLSESVAAMPGLTLDRLHESAAEGSAPQLLRRAISRMPGRRGLGLFSAGNPYDLEYRRMVPHRLDTLELLGVDLARDVKRYSLTTAYVMLNAILQPGRPPQKIDDVLPSCGSRILVTGGAGCGKTTILQWIAVSLARDEMPGGAAHLWHGRVPFLVRLRRYQAGELPALEDLSKEIAGSLHARQPEDWCAGIIREGRAVILVDGLDEVPADRRAEVQEWLDDLLMRVRDNIVVLTSRPAAAKSEAYNLSAFRRLELAAMGPSQITSCVRDWHTATREAVVEEDRDSHRARGDRLVKEILASRVLQDLASTPLLCAVICALNYAHPGGLPHRQIRLYEQALAMMLGRRDHEKGVYVEQLSQDERDILLQHLAEWLILSGRSEASTREVTDRLRVAVRGLLHRLEWTAERVLTDLLERAGVLREPVPEVVDFVHRSFQEYLAAKSFVSGGGVRTLIDRAKDPDWFGVITLAAGHASMHSMSDWSALVSGILDQSDGIDLLVSCVEMSTQVDREVYDRILPHLEKCIPPKNDDDVRSIVAMGNVAIPLLQRVIEHGTQSEVALCVRALSEIGGDRAIPVLAKVARLWGTLAQDLLRAWSTFEPRTYARDVLSHLPRSWLVLTDASRLPYTPLLPKHAHLLAFITGPNAHFATQVRRSRITDLNVDLGHQLEGLDWLPTVEGLRTASIIGSFAFELPDGAPLTDLTSLSLHFEGLSFLDCRNFARLPNVESLSISGEVVVTNIDALAGLRRLTQLSVDEAFRVDWSRPLEHASLQNLVLVGFPERDLMAIAGCTALRSLGLPHSEIITLDGIEDMRELSELDLRDSVWLEDMTAAEGIELSEVDLTGCEELVYLPIDVALLDDDLIATGEHPDDEALQETEFPDAPDFWDDGWMPDFPDEGELVESGPHVDGWMTGELTELEAPALHDMSHDEWREIEDLPEGEATVRYPVAVTHDSDPFILRHLIDMLRRKRSVL